MRSRREENFALKGREEMRKVMMIGRKRGGKEIYEKEWNEIKKEHK
jgi:hypothetical protein